MKKNFISIAAVMVLVSTSAFFISAKYGDQPKKTTCGRHNIGFVAGANPGLADDPFNSFLTCNQAGCHNSYPTKHRTCTEITFSPALDPAGYIPNHTYTVTATMKTTGCPNLGFEISPQSRTGAMMGRMDNLASSPNPTITEGLKVGADSNYYITHSAAAGPNTGIWQFLWKAPAKVPGQRDSVIFYGTYNAGTGISPPLDDTIIACTTVIAEDTAMDAGISNIENPELQFSVYPTVSNGQFTIENKEPDITNYVLSVYNLNGEKVLEKTSNMKFETLNLNIACGMYIIWIKTENATICKKVIITR